MGVHSGQVGIEVFMYDSNLAQVSCFLMFLSVLKATIRFVWKESGK